MTQKKTPLEVLGDRAYLSMWGKGVIGLVGGIILTVLGFFRRHEQNEILQELEKPIVQVKMHVINFTFGKMRREYIIDHFTELGVDSSSAMNVYQYICDMALGGSLVNRINNKQLDSVNKLLSSREDSKSVFCVENVKTDQSFIIVYRDHKIINIVSCRPIDSIIYPARSIVTSYPDDLRKGAIE